MVNQTVDQNKLLEGKREIKVKQGFFRCLSCGNDAERLYPQVYDVNESIFKQIQEIITKDSNFRLIGSSPANPRICKKLDDMTLRPISGTCFNVNIDVCFSCIDKVGWRHKFMDRHKARLYANKPL